jgi:DNA topoisomerase-1
MPPKKYRNYKPTTKTYTSTHLQTAKWLVIVESPSKCKKIEEYLGPDYHCISSKGHIRCIENLNSIDMTDYTIKFSIIEEKKGHIKEMLGTISQFSKEAIIIATDDDREGEAIGWHLCDHFGLDIDSIRRIKFNEITRGALLYAVANPGHIDMNLVKAQHCRQVLDMLVGFKISPILWQNIYKNIENSLSAGRCQTPALKLIYENKREIEACSIKMVYRIRGEFLGKGFMLSREFETEEDVLAFYKASQSHKHILSAKPPRMSYKNPPQPFNTSRLLQYASSHLGLSPKETMSLCQELYQGGFITYMRTDSQKYAKGFLEETREYLIREYGGDHRIIGQLTELIADASAPHEAIRCCHIDMISIDISNDRAVTLYHHIWKNTIQSCMSAYSYKSIDLVVSSSYEGALYHYSIEIPLYIGWMKIGKGVDVDVVQEASTFYMTVSSLVGSQNAYPISYEYLTSVETVKNRISHYTEASLIQKLEEMGIGRPSTYANIVDTLKERGYVNKENIEGRIMKIRNYILRRSTGREIGEFEIIETEKKIGEEKGKLVIQLIGEVVVDFLYRYFTDIFRYDYTATMEIFLDKIANGEINSHSICEDCHIKIIRLSETTGNKKETYHIKDSSEYILSFEKYGLVVKSKEKKNGEYEYKKIRKNLAIDLEKLKRGEYLLLDVLCSQKEGTEGASEDNEGKTSNIQRILTPNLSIRIGKYGSYIFYKTDKMRKPEFYKLNKFREPFLTCDKDVLIKWIYDTYNINDKS